MHERESNGSVISVGRFTVRHDKRKELLMTLNSLSDRIRREKGCKAYHFYGDEKVEDAFILIGEWEKRSDWDRHLSSEYYTILKGSLGILGNGEGLDFTLMTRIGPSESP